MRKLFLRKIPVFLFTLGLSLTSVFSPAQIKSEIAKAATVQNIKRVSVHDPSIAVDKDAKGNTVYYVFGSHIEAARSTDLSNWSRFTNGYSLKNNIIFGDLDTNLNEPFLWAGKDDSDCKGGRAVWAPDVKYNPEYINANGKKGAYMMYFCVSSTYCRSAIAYAVSDKIDGNYKYKGTLVYSGFTKNSAKDKDSTVDKKWENTNIDELMAAGRIDEGFNQEWASNVTYNTDYSPNAIDPAIFTDADGRMWMSYGSWSGGIYLLEIDPATGDAIYPKSNGKTADGRVIDKYFGTRIAGGHTISGEGPYIVYDKTAGYYYLYTTYNYLDAMSGYNMRLFRSKNPDGPYVDASGKSAVFSSGSINQYDIGIKVMGNYNIAGGAQGYRSPGHNSAWISDDGQRYLIYHTRFQSNEYAFETRVHQQFLNSQGWPVTAVYENRGDVISETGYSADEIEGTYHYINHGTASDNEKVNGGARIVLKKDGTISGDATGTWSEEEGSYLATFKIDNQQYDGVFFKQHDEKGSTDAVMTFSAIGNNNKTIWGAKISNDTSDFGVSGSPSTNFSKITTQPVIKYTFDNTEGISELAGKAVVEGGVLKLNSENGSKAQTYARLAGITDQDFYQGITLTADVAVNRYLSDWTPIFMISDSKVGSGSGSYPYHFTQGFSSVADLAGGQIGYYGRDISAPYRWDYFSDFMNRYKWYTITVSMTCKRMSTYVNGIKVQSETKDFKSLMEVFAKADNVYLGGSVFDDPDFCGWIDNVGIYDKALSDDAVKAIATGVAVPAGKAEYIEGEEARFKPKKEEESVVQQEQKEDSASDKTKMPAKGTKLKDPKTGSKYKVTKSGATNGTVAFVSPKSKKVTSVNIPATVKLKGIVYKVTSISDGAVKGCKKLKKVTIGKNIKKIGKKAFYGDKKLKKIICKTKTLKKSGVGKSAFSKINAKAVVQVPKSKKKQYKKIFVAKGLSGKKQSVK